MTLVLDTDICSYLLKRRHPKLIERVAQTEVGELAVSSVTSFELRFGVRRLREAGRWAGVIEAFLRNLQVLPFDEHAAAAAADIRAELEAVGTPIGAYDLLIAGHVRALGWTLVTNNRREFRRVSGLVLEDWLADSS